MNLRRQRALLFFGFVYLVFAFIIAYLMLLTPGLEFEKRGGELFIVNDSIHRIEGIAIDTQDGERLECVLGLDAGEKHRVELPPTRETLALVASAPFHASTEERITPLEAGLVALDFNLYRPREVFSGESFRLELRLCGQGIDFPEISIEERHDPAFFDAPQRTRVVTVTGRQCKSLFYTFLPKKSGATEVSFNIDSVDVKARFTEKFKVRTLG